MRFPQLVAKAALTSALVLIVAGCGAAATPAPANPGSSAAPSTGAATTPAGAATPGATTATAGATASSAPGGATDPCSLLSAADLTTVTGGKFAAGAFDATYNWCDYIVAAKDGGGEVIVAISDNAFATVKGALTQGVDLTVSGHAAFWDPEQGVQSMLVDVGGKTLELSFPKPTSDGAVDQAKAQKLAELALAKM